MTDYMDKLSDLIREAKGEIYNPDYIQETSDAETLGVLVSKFAEWDLIKIKEVVDSALEDSNFNGKDLMEYYG